MIITYLPMSTLVRVCRDSYEQEVYEILLHFELV